MKRIILCCSIISVILIVSIASLFYMNYCNKLFLDKLDTAIISAGNEETDVLKNIDALNQYWKKYYRTLSYFVQNDKLDNVNSSMAKLEPFYNSGNTEFFSECETIRDSLLLIYDNEFPHFRSIF